MDGSIDQSFHILTSLYTVLRHENGREIHAFDLLVASSPVGHRIEVIGDRIRNGISNISDPTKTKGLVFVMGRRLAFLLFSFLGPILPNSWSDMAKLELLDSCFKGSGKRGRFDSILTLAYIVNSMETANEEDHHDPEVLRKIFDAWWSIPPLIGKGEQSSKFLALGDRMAEKFSRLLSQPRVESGVVYELMLQHSENDLIDRCLTFLGSQSNIASKQSIRGSVALLNAIISHDFWRFGPAFLMAFIRRNASLDGLFDKGLLDESALIVIRQSDQLPEYEEEYTRLTAWLLSRCEKAFASLVSICISVLSQVSLL